MEWKWIIYGVGMECFTEWNHIQNQEWIEKQVRKKQSTKISPNPPTELSRNPGPRAPTEQKTEGPIKRGSFSNRTFGRSVVCRDREEKRDLWGGVERIFAVRFF